MNAKSAACVTAALLLTATLSASGQSESDWIEVKGERELRALYSNKTHKGRDWVAHFRDDGKGIITYNDGKAPLTQTWATKGDDQLCVTSSVSTICYRYRRNRGKPGEYMGSWVEQPVHFFVTVEDGIPRF